MTFRIAAITRYSLCHFQRMRMCLSSACVSCTAHLLLHCLLTAGGTAAACSTAKPAINHQGCTGFQSRAA
jgi:hypothetical protein